MNRKLEEKDRKKAVVGTYPSGRYFSEEEIRERKDNYDIFKVDTPKSACKFKMNGVIYTSLQRAAGKLNVSPTVIGKNLKILNKTKLSSINVFISIKTPVTFEKVNDDES